MTPAEAAAQLCIARGGNFREELEAHLLRGYAFAGPDYFLLGRAMPRSADPGDLWAVYARAECDTWFVWLGVGDWRQLLALMPYELPFIGWHRQGREWRDCHWLETAQLRRRLGTTLTALPRLG